MKKIIVASHNAHKIEEYQQFFAKCGVEILSAGDLELPEPEETGSTFEENAVLKLKEAVKVIPHMPLISDDGGFMIDALNGHPGIYSARWAKECGGFQAAGEKLNEMLKGKSPKASMHCAVSLWIPESREIKTFTGRVELRFIYPGRGPLGFGYDSFVIPDGYDRTFSEMGMAEKSGISHRAQAFQKLADYLFKSNI